MFYIHCMFLEWSQKQSFFLQTLLFTPFVATVQQIITYALVSTWSWASSGWEQVTRFMDHWLAVASGEAAFANRTVSQSYQGFEFYPLSSWSAKFQCNWGQREWRGISCRSNCLTIWPRIRVFLICRVSMKARLASGDEAVWEAAAVANPRKPCLVSL